MKIAGGGVATCAGILCAAVMVLGAEEATILQKGAQAPTFSLPTLEGTREALSVYCGPKLSKPYANDVKHLVILSFWATYCKPCQKEIPELMRFMKKQNGVPIKLFCVSIDKEGASIVAPFIKEKNYDIPVLLDPYQTAAKRYGVKHLPALFVIDKEGVIQYSSTGFDESMDLDKKLETVIAQIAEGRVVAEAQSGTSVPVKDEEQTGGESKQIPPRLRWNAVMRVECGESPNEVADELGVTTDELKSWYNQIKKAAVEIWAEKQ